MTWLDDLTLETVIVNTTDGTALKGLKRAVHDDGIILTQAALLEDDSLSVLNGDVFVPREKVLLIQLLGSA